MKKYEKAMRAVQRVLPAETKKDPFKTMLIRAALFEEALRLLEEEKKVKGEESQSCE